MKNIAKMVAKHIRKNPNDNSKKAAGGESMRSYDLDSKKFSRVKATAMFQKSKGIDDEDEDEVDEAAEKPKETCNPSKNVKPLKKMKGKDKKKK